MPELPDVVVYINCLSVRLIDQPLTGIRLGNPFVLRSTTPGLDETRGRTVRALRRLGKRIVIELSGDLFLVVHLMIAGRLWWRPVDVVIPKRRGLAAFDFPSGSLLLTEAGSTKRASLHLVSGETDLARHDPGGLEILDADLPEFHAALQRESHTLKRALTDPQLFSGVGNAYSDEILHAARLSPLALTTRLDDEAVARLYEAARRTLGTWADRLQREVGDGFPEKVTAFRPEMAVHGRYREPCPSCGSPVQRIVFARTEVNYCATCQTGGRLLADRAISRLLRRDWPRTLEEWEDRHAPARSRDSTPATARPRRG